MRLITSLPLLKQFITLSVTIYLMWQLSILVWLAVPAHADDLNKHNVYALSLTESKQVTIDMKQVAAFNLFGLSTKASQINTKKEKQITAPETKLNLKLRGLRKGQGTIKSSAIIEDSRGVQNIYYLADTIDGHKLVSVHEIYSQRLILKRSGKLEALTLFDVLQQAKSEVQKDSKEKIALPQMTRVPVINKTRNKELTQSLSTIADTLKTNPLSLNGTMIIEPSESDGAFQGYKVSPGRDRVLFARLGLVKGDIVTQVNDVELTSSGKIMSLMGTLSSASELEIKVLRRGQNLAFRYKVK